MRAGIVGDELRLAGADEVDKARVGNLDRRMQSGDGGEHLVDGVRRGARRQVAPDAEGEFRLADAVLPSAITVWLMIRPASGPETLMCFCPASLVAAIFQPNN